MHKLLDAVIDAQNRGLCGFYDFSGHVCWVSIRITPSIDDFNTYLYHKPAVQMDSIITPKTVKEVTKEIKDVSKDRKKALNKAKQKEIKEEKKTLAELKKKYE